MVIRRGLFQLRKKVAARFFVFVAVGAAFLAALAFCPAPIEGNWRSSYGCGCESHSFVRFEAGRILFHAGHSIPFEWLGNYERVGWCKYKLSMFYDGESVLLKSRVFLVQPQEPLGIICRDPFVLACWRILQQPENVWLSDPRCICLAIRNVGGETVYSLDGKTVQAEKLEGMFSAYVRTKKRLNSPISVYAPSNVFPSRILSAIATNGFESVIHTSQAWTKDVRKNNLVVRALGGDKRYWVDGQWKRVDDIAYYFRAPEGERCAWWTPVSAVFVPAGGAPEHLRQILADTAYGGAVLTNHPWFAASDPQSAAVVVGQEGAETLIWLSGRPYTVDEFEDRMCGRKNWRSGLNKPLVVYTENTIVPSDLEQTLSRVGCAYETRSVELLRRAK